MGAGGASDSRGFSAYLCDEAGKGVEGAPAHPAASNGDAGDISAGCVDSNNAGGWGEKPHAHGRWRLVLVQGRTTAAPIAASPALEVQAQRHLQPLLCDSHGGGDAGPLWGCFSRWRSHRRGPRLRTRCGRSGSDNRRGDCTPTLMQTQRRTRRPPPRRGFAGVSTPLLYAAEAASFPRGSTSAATASVPATSSGCPLLVAPRSATTMGETPASHGTGGGSGLAAYAPTSSSASAPALAFAEAAVAGGSPAAPRRRPSARVCQLACQGWR
jgi:hypothetical protein